MKHARKCSRYSTVDYGLISKPTRKLSKHCSVDSSLLDTTKQLSKTGRIDVEPTQRHYKKTSKHSYNADGVCIPRLKVKTARRKSSITTLNSPILSSRKPSLISLKQTGSSDVPSPSSSFSYDDGELTDEQRDELKKAFKMFEKAGKGKMPARNLGSLLRCLGWNPSERELEEARHELDISARGSMSFAEVERYVARRGGIYNGSKEEDDISEAFQMLGQCETGKISVKKFKYFMTTLGEKMTDEEVEEFLGFMKKDGVAFVECKDLIQALQNFDLSS